MAGHELPSAACRYDAEARHSDPAYRLPVASVTLLVFLWWADLLPRPVCGCSMRTGWRGPDSLLAPVYSLAWVAALLLNAGAAIYLAILLKLSS